MGELILNHASGVPYQEQWRRHLQTQEYVNDIKGAIENSTAAYNERSRETAAAVRQSGELVSGAVETAAVAQIADARRNAAAIVGTLQLTSERMTEKIDALGRALDFGLDALIYQHSVGNLLLNDIRQLLRIPDFQKERLHYTEAGLKHFYNARIDPSFYREALDALLEAEQREKTDYVVLNTIGMIRGFAERLPDALGDIIDLSAAETYFLRAARYAAIESHPEVAQLTSILSFAASEQLASERSDPKRFAADAYNRAGLVCYGQGKFVEAAAHARKGIEVDADYLLPRFHECKFLAAAGEVDEAAKKLEAVIRADRSYSETTKWDPDLVTKEKVLQLLALLRDEAAERLKGEIGSIEQRHAPFFGPGGDAFDQVARLHQATRDNEYLPLMAALDEAPLAKDAIALWDRTRSSIAELGSLLEPHAPVVAAVKLATGELPVTKSLAYVSDLHEAMRGSEKDVNAGKFAEHVSTAQKAQRAAKVEYDEARKVLTKFQHTLSELKRVMGTKYLSHVYTSLRDGSTKYEEQLGQAQELLAAAANDIAILDYSKIAEVQRNSAAAQNVARDVSGGSNMDIATLERERSRIQDIRSEKSNAAFATGVWAVPVCGLAGLFVIGFVGSTVAELAALIGVVSSGSKEWLIALSLVGGLGIGLSVAISLIREKL